MTFKKKKTDKEVEQFRNLLPIPEKFENGFGWTTVVGLFFCGFIMIPGGIYLGLMTGGNLSQAASWVTVILFMELSRRALKPLNQQELVVLLHAARVMMLGNMLFPGGPLAHIVYRAYYVGSDAVRDAGMLGAFPSWFAPDPDSPAILERNLFHQDWWLPLAVFGFVFAISLVKKYTLGYFFFRLTSDVEKLPFPLAPISAQGAMALAESEDSDKELSSDDVYSNSRTSGKKDKSKGKRWRLFSLGAYVGIAFGALQIGVPAITGLFLSKPIFLIPQPFVDTTTFTEAILPATPTGIALNLGLVILGFVVPFWAVMGAGIAVLLTFILNPILQSTGMLSTWQPGMDTVNTTFSNNVDFWLSFNIGAGFAIAAVSIYSTVRDIRRAVKNNRKKPESEEKEDLWAPPRKGRGDYPLWIAGALYCVSALAIVILCLALLPFSYGIAFFLIFFAFVYSPFLSYVNARLLGISGQTIEIPYVREASFLLSGAKGVEIWLAPVPLENFGQQAESFRVNELTGVNFWSLIKTDLVALPILFFLSLAFWAFIWKADPVPSALFPAAQINWELQAKNQTLIYSSTFVIPGQEGEEKSFSETELGKALKPGVIGGSFASVVALFTVMSGLGLPVMLVYGLIKGLGDFPHNVIPEVFGALLARFYFYKKFGAENFLKIAPTILAGYMTGVGFIGMATFALTLIKNAVSGAPF